MVRLAQPLVILSFLWPSVLGVLELETDSGEIVTVENEKDLLPRVEQQELGHAKRSISPRELFSRQRCSAPGQRILCGTGCCPNDQACCENSGCIDLTRRICCPNNRSCPVGGECCRGGGCCNDGAQCVRNVRTGRRSCRRPNGGRSDNDDTDVVSSADLDSTSTSTRTRTRTTSTSESSTTSTSTSTTTSSSTALITGAGTRGCSRDGWVPCADDRVCCPSGSYCYWDRESRARCHRGGAFYTYRYYYSWTFSATTRWYRTTTVYYLGGSGSIASVTPPPPPTTPPAETQATVPAALATLTDDLSFPTPTGTGSDAEVTVLASTRSGAGGATGGSNTTPTSSPSSTSFRPTPAAPTPATSTPPVQQNESFSIRPSWTALLPTLGGAMAMILVLGWM